MIHTRERPSRALSSGLSSESTASSGRHSARPVRMKALATLSATWPSAAPSSSVERRCSISSRPASSARCAARSSSVKPPSSCHATLMRSTAVVNRVNGLFTMRPYKSCSHGSFSRGGRNMVIILTALLAGSKVLPMVDRDALDMQARAEALQPRTAHRARRAAPAAAAPRLGRQSARSRPDHHHLPRRRRAGGSGGASSAGSPPLIR